MSVTIIRDRHQKQTVFVHDHDRDYVNHVRVSVHVHLKRQIVFNRHRHYHLHGTQRQQRQRVNSLAVLDWVCAKDTLAELAHASQLEFVPRTITRPEVEGVALPLLRL